MLQSLASLLQTKVVESRIYCFRIYKMLKTKNQVKDVRPSLIPPYYYLFRLTKHHIKGAMHIQCGQNDTEKIDIVKNNDGKTRG